MDKYKVGDKVEHRRMSKWQPGTVVATCPNDGPDGETTYVIGYTLDDGSKHVTGKCTAKTLRVPVK